MALKDWKKLPERKEIDYNTTWYNKDIAKIVIHVVQSNYMQLNSLGYKVYVEVFKKNNKNIYPEDNYFKTRTEALKYVKSYMRKH